MAKLVYMPVPGDAASTTVDRFDFAAYVATEVPDERGDLIAKLKRNPWFADPDKVDEARFEQWSEHADAKQLADIHRARAEQLDQKAVEAEKAGAAARAAEKAALKAAPQPAPGDVPVEAEKVHDDAAEIVSLLDQAKAEVEHAHANAVMITAGADVQAQQVLEAAKAEAERIVAEAQAKAAALVEPKVEPVAALVEPKQDAEPATDTVQH